MNNRAQKAPKACPTGAGQDHPVCPAFSPLLPRMFCRGARYAQVPYFVGENGLPQVGQNSGANYLTFPFAPPLSLPWEREVGQGVEADVDERRKQNVR